MTVVAFDFDGTLSDSEMTVLLGKQCGVADEMADITERSMNDEIDYAESLRKRAALLEGLDEEDVAAAYAEVKLREGAASLIDALNDAGVTTAILTGGFERGVEAALEREEVAVDHVVSNRLPMVDGRLTGEVEGSLIEGTKDTALEDLANRVGAEMEETVAVGDGANDLPMLRVAGLSIGFDPKPAVEPHCEVVVTSMAGVRDTMLAEGVLDRT
ncbi:MULTISPECIES: phosphoserine phosphatase SerB [Natrialbaceae]|uniref:phosphoserine phosphatase SerB n=1 Tax=Natrialbaceae TaxID=1644061 RepID=UPI00207C8FCC|nr:phosphoserine phosphatase SerB [Natronococcus sp. CG52]